MFPITTGLMASRAGNLPAKENVFALLRRDGRQVRRLGSTLVTCGARCVMQYLRFEPRKQCAKAQLKSEFSGQVGTYAMGPHCKQLALSPFAPDAGVGTESDLLKRD
jgi:hypothetical protein